LVPAAGGGADAVSVTVGPATWTVAVTVGPGTVRVTVVVLPHAPTLTARPMPASPVAAWAKGFIRGFLGFGVFMADVTVQAPSFVPGPASMTIHVYICNFSSRNQ
jgi:hypothetical protein